MREERAKYINAGWLKANLYNTLAGAGIGIVICLFITAAQGKLVSLHTFYIYTFFSIMISLGVINGILIAQRIFRLRYENISFVIIYYAASLVGMVVGTEAARFILALINGYHYSFSDQQDILFRSLVVFLACTAGYIHHSQKVSLQNRIKQKELDMARLSQLKIQAELATLHARINPHFLYNALNSIASLIHIDADKAEAMTLKLSKLFRYSINHDQEDMVSVRDEIDICNTYLDIEKVRFADRINFGVEVDPQVMDLQIPRFLIQPLIENALKHGLRNTTGKGELLVNIQPAGEFLEISVADNGRPFPEELQIGYGLQSTYDKLALLYGENYQLSISNEPSKKIKILIPVNND